MTTLTLIGEPFPDCEHRINSAVARELTEAVAASAPRGCSSRILVPNGVEAPAFSSPRARAELIPLKSSLLPVLWQSRATAKPLDGEFVHAITPMVPLRNREEDDGSQTSVMIPHGLAWEAPELLSGASIRLYRAFVRRAVRLADVILTPTHALAAKLQARYGSNVPIRVLPLAAPTSYLEPEDAAERRSSLELPERYLVTTALPGEQGRVEWVLNALRENPDLPPVVILRGCFPGATDLSWQAEADESVREAIPEELRDRVRVVRLRELSDVGAVLSGALLLALPQQAIATGYEVYGALANGVPVLHAAIEPVAEMIFDAGVAAKDAETFSVDLARLLSDDEERERLAILARDRSRAFTWENTAWQLWEMHANL